MWKRWVLPVGLGLLLGFAAWPSARFVRAEIRSTPTPAVRPRLCAYRHVAFMEWARTHPHSDVLFLGDSLTDFWRDNLDLFNQRFPGAANFGVVADRIEDVQWRVQAGEMEAVHPKVVVLLIGTNNLLAGDSADQAVSKVRVLLALIQARQPGVRLVLVGLPPLDYPPLSSPTGTLLVNQVNRGLGRIEGVEFVDFGAKLLNPDGSFNPALQPDHLHLSPAGYQIWADALRPLL